MQQQKAQKKVNRRITVFFSSDEEAIQWREIEKQQKAATGRGILFYRLECFRKGMESIKATNGGKTTRGAV